MQERPGAIAGGPEEPVSAIRRHLTVRWVVPLGEGLSGRRPFTEARRLRALQWRSADEVEAQAVARLQALLAHAHEHVPYYRRLFERAGIGPGGIKQVADLARLPLTGKGELRAHFPDGVVAANVPARRRFQSRTSGSAGLPFEFYADRADDDARLGSYLFFWEWAGAAVGDTVSQLIVSLRPAAPVPGASSLVRTARRLVLGEAVVTLSGLGLTGTELAARVAELPARRPYLLWGLPSVMAQVAVEMLERGATLPRPPRVVVATGDTLSAPATVAMEQAFRCPVVNHYSASEVLHVAQTCPDNPDVLHVNSRRALLRVVREDGTDVSPGESGRVVLTHLGNWVMPLVNYDVGDWATVGAPCPCGRGFPTLARIEGRAGETFRTADGRTVSPNVLGWFLTNVSRMLPYLWEFQAVLTAPHTLVLRVVGTSRFSAEIAGRLVADLEAFLGPPFQVRVELVDRIPAEPSGKRFIIKSEVAPDPAA